MPTLPVQSDCPAIQIADLVKCYGDVRAVDGVTLAVPQGDFFGFLGPNGAGKTSLIHCMVGLARITSGAIKVFGNDVVGDYRAARRLIGLCPQEFNFDRYLTVRETLLYSAGYFGIGAKEAKSRADDLLGRFDLAAKRESDVAKLSGGMKRRLAIARALIHRPRVVVLDEPTAGVDVEMRLELWQFLRSVNQEGTTVFLTTHYLEEAESLCNRIGIIDGGRMIALEDKRGLLARMAGHTLRVFFASPPIRPLQLPEFGTSQSTQSGEIEVRGLIPAQVAGVLSKIAEYGEIKDVEIERKSLQEVFLELTSRLGTFGAAR